VILVEAGFLMGKTSEMKRELNALAADRAFFEALISRDAHALDELLTDDFVLIDVLRGGEIPKPALLAAVGAGQVKFEAIEPSENRVRKFASTAIVTGRTQMRGRAGETPFAARSRYTHVYVEQDGRLRLAAAQGTPIVEE
jgi:ketosteroid isomerase-like protein